MATAEIIMGEIGGGGNHDAIFGTSDGTNFSANWDYDATTVVIFFKTGAISQVMLLDVTTKYFWLAHSSGGAWSSSGSPVTWTVTPRSISDVPVSSGVNILDVIPLTNKPEGYFT